VADCPDPEPAAVSAVELVAARDAPASAVPAASPAWPASPAASRGFPASPAASPGCLAPLAARPGPGAFVACSVADGPWAPGSEETASLCSCVETAGWLPPASAGSLLRSPSGPAPIGDSVWGRAPSGASSQRPWPGPPKRAEKTEGESKRGRQSQSMLPDRDTSAPVCRSDMSAYSSIGDAMHQITTKAMVAAVAR